MPTAPPGEAVLAPAISGDGKTVITSTNTTVRLTIYLTTVLTTNLRIFFYQIFSQMLKTEKKMPFFTNISQLKNKINSLLVKKGIFFLSFEHLRKSKQILHNIW